MNLKTISAISVLVALATVLFAQMFLVGFSIGTDVGGSVVNINSHDALIEIQPLENFATVNSGGQLTVNLPEVGPGSAPATNLMNDENNSYTAIYVWKVVDVQYNGNGTLLVNASIEQPHFSPSSVDQNIGFLILAYPNTSTLNSKLLFANNMIPISQSSSQAKTGQISLGGVQFTLLATLNVNQHYTTGGVVLTGGHPGYDILIVELLVNNPGAPSQTTFDYYLNLYGYQLTE
ncbi:hypothetical protein [Metallosphaera hakonensis]|uniref:Uncharacterized protein n=1 Tax=Metallosphaera hakonensis JCM 8857 = DSM 7519 TaxID=1293036 RepID=A0A2U9IWN0_9CREN|nr:hypothetical protein [Metallosphaera hakonensis]AWS00363.1 hypothetical protein DFR87_12535 [Metallosphaera hakonensis JCM 8857 = DSM 7519]